MSTVSIHPSESRTDFESQKREALRLLTAGNPTSIHKGFFLSGIAVILTFGAVWGAYLLLRIAWEGSFTSVGIHEVNAHGHAQIFGWVGLFVKGFAYLMFPRFKQTALSWPVGAKLSLVLMLAGIVLRSSLEPFARTAPWTVWPALFGNGLELIAIGIFLQQMVGLMRRSLLRLSGSDVLILSALGWFAVQAVYETVYFAAIAWAPTREEMLHLVATWQAPLRDAQIHGFSMLIVFGVSLRILPAFFGWRSPSARVGTWLAAVLNVAVLLQIVSFILMREVGYRWGALWGLAALLLLGGAIWQVRALGVLRSPALHNRSAKFVRTAYVWLLLSLVMLVSFPVWQFVILPMVAPGSGAVEMGFSHAYYGSIRHAITVGFISLMIMGVGAFVAAETRWGSSPPKLTALWAPFILVNAGCAMRVFFQLTTDIGAWAFPVTGISGILEVTGIAIWGGHMARVMLGR